MVGKQKLVDVEWHSSGTYTWLLVLKGTSMTSGLKNYYIKSSAIFCCKLNQLRWKHLSYNKLLNIWLCHYKCITVNSACTTNNYTNTGTKKVFLIHFDMGIVKPFCHRTDHFHRPGFSPYWSIVLPL